jgi:ATP-dependent Lhr-like helicase
VTLAQIQQRYALPEDRLRSALATLVRDGDVVHGKLTAEATELQWCDRHNLERLYRQAVVRRREFSAPADLSSYLKFLILYHSIDPPRRQPVSTGLWPLVQRFRGLTMPVGFFEREVLPTRLASPGGVAATISEAERLLADWTQAGRLVWRVDQDGGGTRALQLFQRGEGNLFVLAESLEERLSDLSAEASAVYELLKNNGASFSRDIELATGLSPSRVLSALAELAWRGLVTNDHWSTVTHLALAPSSSHLGSPESASFLPEELPGWASRGRPMARRKRNWRRERRSRPLAVAGRWSLVNSFAVLGPELSQEERVRRQAMLLVERYGVLAKEHYRRESGLLPWPLLFRELKRLEWRGEIRRGYFVEGLSGVQFATAEATELLRRVCSGEDRVSEASMLLSAMDPAVPFGGGAGLKLRTAAGRPVAFTRQISNHLLLLAGAPVFYLEGYGSRLWPLRSLSEGELKSSLALLRTFLELPPVLRPRKKVEVISWEDGPISESPAARILPSLGFERDGDTFVLWPSGLGAG